MTKATIPYPVAVRLRADLETMLDEVPGTYGFDGLVDALMILINRDLDLFLKYPEKVEAVLDQYRNGITVINARDLTGVGNDEQTVVA